MEWFTDPTVWFGLATLVFLEIVLGIDNLVFIAIISDKLPSSRRKTARQLGLALALFARLLMLAGVFWITTLTRPIFSIFGHSFSGRDLILLGGGLFLLLKARIEIHDRLESAPVEEKRFAEQAGFGAVIAQIVVLDAVFSIDSILTAVGMTNQIAVMMAAVVIAIAVMLVASKPLSDFVNGHPPLIILCLGFLLMIGLSLVADGAGFHIPKGYLYTAIGFSVLIETFNQIAQRNRQKWMAKIPRRQRIAQAVLRLLGGVPAGASPATAASVDALVADTDSQEVLVPVEKQMIHGVLGLAERTIRSIMTPRREVAWVDLGDVPERIISAIRNSRHSQLLVGRDAIDEVTGIVRKQDLLNLCLDGKPINVEAVMQPPVILYESSSVLHAIELFKKVPVHAGIVVDEYGVLQGILTQTDLLESIAGELPEEEDSEPDFVRLGEDSFTLDAALSTYDLGRILGLSEIPRGDYNTLAGFALSQMGRIPAEGDGFDFGGWHFEISQMDGPRISKVLASRLPAPHGVAQS